ncbi:MAG: P-loop domain-containing protein [Eubacteriales bacterium]
MYEGHIVVYDGTVAPPITDFDSTYYDGETGYDISRSGKKKLELPTILIMIPADDILGDISHTEGENILKRLRYYFNFMENDTQTYRWRDTICSPPVQRDLYDGRCVVNFPPKSNGELLDPDIQQDSLYFQENIGYDISRSQKDRPDVPTVTAQIPCEALALDESFHGGTVACAAADHCLRAFAPYIDSLNSELENRARDDRENGKYYLYRPDGEVLLRNSAYFAVCRRKDYHNGGGYNVYLENDDVERAPRMCLCIRIQVQLPYKKLKKAVKMLCTELPSAVNSFIADFDHAALENACKLAQLQCSLRQALSDSGYAAFIANGSILPRESGSDRPMKNAIPFKSAPQDEITLCGITGMGFPRGVSVITGGGYSGKSTLLDALGACIYDHTSGDGRELCVTDASAVKISAEDGRVVMRDNISPFIKWIPGGSPEDFSTAHASGSTSQAANIVEAVNCGAALLLIDEDRSATNFMIRDAMMKRLIRREPITPFTDRVRELSANGVSTILVIGGSGEYLSVADKIYMMEDFIISDATESSRRISPRRDDFPENVSWDAGRLLGGEHFSSYPEGKGTERLEISELGFIIIGGEAVDIRALYSFITPAQRTAAGFILREMMVTNDSDEIDVGRRLDEIYEKIARDGLDTVWTGFFEACGRFLDLPRKFEIIAVIDRMRNIKIKRI